MGCLLRFSSPLTRASIFRQIRAKDEIAFPLLPMAAQAVNRLLEHPGFTRFVVQDNELPIAFALIKSLFPFDHDGQQFRRGAVLCGQFLSDDN